MNCKQFHHCYVQIQICCIIDRVRLAWRRSSNISVKKPASLSENVKIAHLPEPDTPCPSGQNLIASGWGKRVIWVGSNAVETKCNRFLCAVKEECVDIDQCNAYQGDKEAALCVGELSEPRSFVFRGDSGGIKRIKIFL